MIVLFVNICMYGKSEKNVLLVLEQMVMYTRLSILSFNTNAVSTVEAFSLVNIMKLSAENGMRTCDNCKWRI